MRVNYLGSVWCLRAFLPGLRAGRALGRRQRRLGRGQRRVPAVRPLRGVEARPARVLARDGRPAPPRGIRVHTVKPGFAETEGFPQAWLPKPLQRLRDRSGRVAAHILGSLERRRGETTVPRYYAPAGVLQALMPNVFARVLSRGSRRRLQSPE